MALEKPMYSPIAFSPVATLTSDIAVGSTVIPVSDVNAFPPAPSYATIGDDANAETIRYTAKTADSLSGCVRGVEGVAQAWQTGESIARNFTAEDHQAIIENLTEMDERVAQAYSPNNKPTATDVGALGFVGSIPSGSDLNNYKSTGMWYITVTNSSSILNIPFTAAGYLIVFNSDTTNTRVLQIFTRTNATSTSNSGLYYRKVSDEGISEWKEIATADEFLPLSGGTLTGSVLVDRGTSYGAVSVHRTISNIIGNIEMGVSSQGGKPWAQVSMTRNDVECGGIIIGDTSAGEPALRYKKAGGTYAEFFGEHNKPTGTYTGTGVSRTVDVGNGIGEILFIKNSSLGSYLVTANGAFRQYGSAISALTFDQAHISNGGLVLSASSPLNDASKGTYTYQWI